MWLCEWDPVKTYIQCHVCDCVSASEDRCALQWCVCNVLSRHVIRWRFVSRVETQMKAFMKGLNALIPQNLLQIFDENEVEVGSFAVKFTSTPWIPVLFICYSLHWLCKGGILTRRRTLLQQIHWLTRLTVNLKVIFTATNTGMVTKDFQVAEYDHPLAPKTGR